MATPFLPSLAASEQKMKSCWADSKAYKLDRFFSLPLPSLLDLIQV